MNSDLKQFHGAEQAPLTQDFNTMNIKYASVPFATLAAAQLADLVRQLPGRNNQHRDRLLRISRLLLDDEGGPDEALAEASRGLEHATVADFTSERPELALLCGCAALLATPHIEEQERAGPTAEQLGHWAALVAGLKHDELTGSSRPSAAGPARALGLQQLELWLLAGHVAQLPRPHQAASQLAPRQVSPTGLT